MAYGLNEMWIVNPSDTGKTFSFLTLLLLLYQDVHIAFICLQRSGSKSYGVLRPIYISVWQHCGLPVSDGLTIHNP